MIKGLYGFTSACALIMTIALIPEYVGIIPGAMIFLCGGLFTFLIIKIIEEEQKAGGESSQNLWPPDPGPGQIPGRSWTRVIYFQGRRCYGSQIYFIRWVSPNLNKKARLKHRVFFFTRRVASYVSGRKCPELSGSRMPWPYPAQLGKNPVNAGFFLPGRIYHARVRKRSQNLRAKQNALERKNI